MKNIDKENLIVIFILVILSGFIIAVLVYKLTAFTYESYPMIIEVAEKKTWTTTTYIRSEKIMVPQYHYYYKLIGSDEYEIDVDSSVYHSTEIGDRIIIIKTNEIEKSTGNIVKITYKYGG